MRPSRCQGTAAPCVVSSSACDSVEPTRRITNRPRFSKKMVLFEKKIQYSEQQPFGVFRRLVHGAPSRERRGHKTPIGNHSFRAIGITDYLERGGDINIAKRMAGHSNVKTTELYDSARR
jgi:site-specific recombinase XerD